MADEYTKEQVIAYYDRISLPEAARKFEVTQLEPKASLDYLKLLSFNFHRLGSSENSGHHITTLLSCCIHSKSICGIISSAHCLVKFGYASL